MYDFDKEINRRGTSCLKWDFADSKFQGKDLLPMWIADMDFEAAPAIIEHMQKRLDEKVFGYSALPDEYYEAVISWMKRRHNYQVKREWINYTAGVVSALNYAVEAVTEPLDEIMVLTPVYGPFYNAIKEQGRVEVKVPLINKDELYTFDFEAMQKAITPKTKVLMLCSPHNPVGRVWTRSELEQLSEFCIKNNLIVIDDEIHNDLVFGKEHIVLGRISPEIEQRCIICTAPSKTFNLAGIQVSNIIIPNEELCKKYESVVVKHHTYSPNSFTASALIGAYNESEQWLDELLVYLEGNVNYFVDYINEKIPLLKTKKPDGTYLVWVDCRKLGLSNTEVKRFFVDKCKLAVNDGSTFGIEGEQYVRFNLACPRSIIKKALERIEKECSL